MGAPYAQELRLRVLAAIDEGLSKTKAHQTFKVSRSTIDDWLKLRPATGKLEANTKYHRGPRPTLEAGPELRTFIERHRNCTLGQLAEAWFQERGQTLSAVTFPKTLRKLGYTRKKRVTSTKNAR